jgi:hypothetical protein
VCLLDSIAPREALIRRVVRAAVRQGRVEQALERRRRPRDRCRVVRQRVRVEDHGGPGLPGPGERRLIVALDQSHDAVDPLRRIFAQDAGGVGEEVGQGGARDVELAQHLRAGRAAAEADRRAATAARVGDQRSQRAEVARPLDAGDARAVELRANVGHPFARRRGRRRVASIADATQERGGRDRGGGTEERARRERPDIAERMSRDPTMRGRATRGSLG